MFEKVLVANRGEIARRIFRACRELGVRSVAIYSDVDRSAPWARQADESYELPGATARQTYLNQDLILGIAKATRADAIHPGYGFLSENAGFAEACERARVHFIGPTPAAMRALGDKAGSRLVAKQVRVPVIPGVDGAEYSDEELGEIAESLGFPVLIKASGGGGGKGMRVVRAKGQFQEALRTARSESMSSFGSDHVLVEKYFTDVRHIEVQVLGDRHGQIVHLFERECSVQRRHQKIIEESPSPAVGSSLREAMTKAALSLANAVGYMSAGTLEFVLTGDGNFYFLEMNTRLQVEHPVTELVTGIDLAAWQIRLASGEPLTFVQSDLKQQGHAIECRIYAEDPQRDFLPSIGQIEFYRPPAGPGVRVDDGIEQGTQVSPYYDPMLAKIVTYGDDRREAIRKMVRALEDTVIFGVTTNIPYLLDILANGAFLAGDVSTKFIEQQMDPWHPAADTSNSTWLSLAAFESLRGNTLGGKQITAAPSVEREGNQLDPWQNGDGWRNTSA